MILRVLSHQDDVQIGATYRRSGGGAVEEVARVLDVAPDRMGIPHVRFQLQVARGSAAPSNERRTLSLEAFRTRYREKLDE